MADRATLDEDKTFSQSTKADWDALAEGLRERRKAAARAPPDDDDDDDVFADDKDERVFSCGRRCMIYFLSAVLALAMVGGWQLWLWFNQ